MQNPEPSSELAPSTPPTRRRVRRIWIIPAVLLLVVAVGASAGYFSGQSLHSQREQALSHARVAEQYNLAIADFDAGRYKTAIERLNNVLQNEPDFPGALEKQQEALAAANATPTPLPTDTPVPSPTPDVPRAEQLLTQAKQQFTDKDYPAMITTLLTLKTENPGFQPERVDGLIWAGLRYNGVHLIKDTNRLTEGLYYLDLAANYAPLDSEADAQAKFAITFLDLYQDAYYYRTKDKEVSMKDFVQVAGMRPYYRDNLITDYGDIVIANAAETGSPCGAVEVYTNPLFVLPILEGYEPFTTARDQAQRDCDASRPTAVPTEVPTAMPTEVPTEVPTTAP
jgi:tetratricopeptide (TPR) repeat protein